MPEGQPKKTSRKAHQYRALAGLSYPPGDLRAEPGDIVDNLPGESIKWLLDDGLIEQVDTQAADAKVEE